MALKADILARDVRFAIRGFVRTPLFTLPALLALALGIGAGTAVFSVLDLILFRSLPYPQSDRLVSIGMVAPIVPQEFLLGYDYWDWRESQSPFQSVGSWTAGVADCDLSDTNPVRLRCARIDSTLLPTLGIQPLAGRNFTRQEEAPNAPKTALISYGLWRGRFGGDTQVVGRTIPLDGQNVAVAGVLPPGFELPGLEKADILVPQLLDDPEQRARRSAIVVFTVGRLKPDVTPEQAATALQALFDKSLQAVTPSFRKDIKLLVRSLRDRQIHESRRASWILLGAVLAVLLIACANVANLLLARAASRERELAVRAALGAGRGRLMRQALTESTLLAVAGGAAGSVVAAALLRFFVSLAPEGIPRLEQAAVDMRVLLFTLAVSLACGVLFGLVPALHGPRAEALSGGRAPTAPNYRFRQCLAAVQICVSMVLLTGAGLLLRSLWNLQNQPFGMRTVQVMSAGVTLGRTTYSEPARRLEFFEALEARLRRIPGVGELAIADSLPPAGNLMGSMLYAAIDVKGRPRFKDGTGGMVSWRSVTPRYFTALNIPLLRGRVFDEQDREASQNVVIVSNTLARRMFPGEDPLGKQIQPGRRGEWLTVIGVAGDVKNNGLQEPVQPEYYVVRKHSAEGVARSAVAIIRTGMPPQAMAQWVRDEVRALDPTLPVSVETVEQHVGKLAARPRFNTLLLGIFAGTGLLLTAIGLYGLMAYLVTQRTREIGVRMALGSTPGGIARLVLEQAGIWTVAGAGLGLIGSLLTVRWLESLLFQVPAKDPWTHAGALAILVGVALASTWIPSRRAARIDPMLALRQD